MAKKAPTTQRKPKPNAAEASKKPVAKSAAPAKSAPKAAAPKPVSRTPANKSAPTKPAKVVEAKAPAKPAAADKSAKSAPAGKQNIKITVKTGAKPAATSSAAKVAPDTKKAPEPKVAPALGKKPPTKGSKPEAPAAPTAPKHRYTLMSNDAVAAGRAAAAKLAAAAGLHSIKNTFNGEAEIDDTPRLTKTPFGKKELREFRDMLVEKRRQLATDVESMESEALHGGGSGSLSHLPQHMADQGTDTYDQTLNLDLAASQRGLLKEIDDALKRIEEGTFGVCERLGRPIHIERLKHTPWARFSIEAARQMERASLLR